MTVRELIDQLSCLPYEVVVMVRGYEKGHHEVNNVRLGVSVMDVENPDDTLYGQHAWHKDVRTALSDRAWRQDRPQLSGTTPPHAIAPAVWIGHDNDGVRL